jgi:hypothetical protein
MYRTAVKILDVMIGVQSNTKKCLPRLPLNKDVDSLLTDFRSVEKHPFSIHLDGYITVEDTDSEPTYEFSGNEFCFKGAFSKLAKKTSDRRFTFWGNQGFLYRFALYLLEKNHRILNLHACALYDEDREAVYVITGGGGSGKTVFLLSGLEKGFKLFSTETVHVRSDNKGITLFKGSLIDNVRWGTLAFNFPDYLPKKTTVPPENIWSRKVAVNLSSFQSRQDNISNPREVHIIFPRIEEGRQGSFLDPIEDKKKSIKKLFDNISQKLTETVVLYDSIPVLGLDEETLANQRLIAVSRILSHPSIKRVTSVLSNPRECWDDLLKTEEET